jgi:hypothetical protein
VCGAALYTYLHVVVQQRILLEEPTHGVHTLCLQPANESIRMFMSGPLINLFLGMLHPVDRLLEIELVLIENTWLKCRPASTEDEH